MPYLTQGKTLPQLRQMLVDLGAEYRKLVHDWAEDMAMGWDPDDPDEPPPSFQEAHEQSHAYRESNRICHETAIIQCEVERRESLIRVRDQNRAARDAYREEMGLPPWNALTKAPRSRTRGE